MSLLILKINVEKSIKQSRRREGRKSSCKSFAIWKIWNQLIWDWKFSWVVWREQSDSRTFSLPIERAKRTKTKITYKGARQKRKMEKARTKNDWKFVWDCMCHGEGKTLSNNDLWCKTYWGMINLNISQLHLLTHSKTALCWFEISEKCRNYLAFYSHLQLLSLNRHEWKRWTATAAHHHRWRIKKKRKRQPQLTTFRIMCERWAGLEHIWQLSWGKFMSR